MYLPLGSTYLNFQATGHANHLTVALLRGFLFQLFYNARQQFICFLRWHKKFGEATSFLFVQ
jgi:hypothetical protein